MNGLSKTSIQRSGADVKAVGDYACQTRPLNDWFRFRKQFAATIADSLGPTADEVREATYAQSIFKSWCPCGGYPSVGCKPTEVLVEAFTCGAGHAVNVVRIGFNGAYETYYVDSENVVWWVGKTDLCVRDQEHAVPKMLHELAYRGWKEEDGTN